MIQDIIRKNKTRRFNKMRESTGSKGNYVSSEGMKYAKFKEVAGSEYDYRLYERILIGRLTKERYKAIDRYCRMYYIEVQHHCGHEWDCCGCFCGQSLSFTHKYNQTIITLSQSFNY